MDESEIEKHRKIIDQMSHEEMARLWRFAPSGHPYFDRRLPLVEHFEKRFKKLGGFTPEISKEINKEIER